ncbi:DUF3667 domain-containing protein [Algoriphagus sediminis]|uniref:DUF3667 domain-containing protein n=1 Tax=Algoriphagus sediminis TaxID=3057113 RepID=A0ABT7YDJ6_9BACT|nr:DUF3667 domain-containing protein [Algoriphagus sediminis]MDN3204587.1 DUF3667 domain-containing protein [Algoriphagus sediminis]
MVNSSTTENICKNCGAPIEGNFCSECGQNARVGKITLRGLIEEISSSIFSIDKGFYFTFIELLKRPGKTIRAYLDGKRKTYWKPIPYALAASTGYFLIALMMGQNTFINDFMTGFFSQEQSAPDALAETPILDWFSSNYAYTVLLLIPVYALASWIAFWSSKRNYLEHIVLNAYITGQQAFFYGFSTVIFGILPISSLEFIPLLVSVAYNFWAFQQFFQKGRPWVRLLRTLATYVLFLILTILLTGLLLEIQRLSV